MSRQVCARWAGTFIMAAMLASCGETPDDPRAKPPLVRTAEAGVAGASEREFSGVVGARVQSDLGFRIGGKITARLVDAGQLVRRGQPLMRIDPADYRLAAAAAAGTVDAARARAIQTAADENRYRDLVGAGAVSASAYDQAKAAARAARADLASAEAQLGARRNDAGYTLLVADADGVVAETLGEPGQVVAAGQTVIRLARSGPREAVVQLPETLRPALGTIARAETYSGLSGAATLRELSAAADPATRTFAAKFTLAGAPASAPLGSTVTIRLGAPDDTGRISVPLAAIDDRGRGPGVWVVQGGKVRFRPVKIAALGEETATLAGGLRTGERFAALGVHLLREGQPVRIQTGAAR